MEQGLEYKIVEVVPDFHVEKCPVCNGNGLKPGDKLGKHCISCRGRGYIFVPNTAEVFKLMTRKTRQESEE